MSKLLIVESPTKAHHIQEFLGDDWQVKASIGHVRDLEKSGDKSYVRPPDFKMNYSISDDKKDTVASLKAAAAKADGVYLATDPDREGEAIAWHLCQVLGIRPADAKRVTYQEVTESAVKKAVANPRTMDMKLVAAQEVRRGLDRMVGWECSGPLSNVVGTKASAGRVQTPALRIIVEREQAIRSFKPTAFFQIMAHMQGGWRAQWQDGTADGEYFQDKSFADALVYALPGMNLAVTQAESKPTKKGPPAPFTTSTLQQDGSRALKIGTEAVMKTAQGLFETGAITYHRTDSPNLSAEGEALLRDALQAAGLPLIEQPRRWKLKEGAQEAHEAIRPTDPMQEDAGQDATQQALYSLIRKRALASQMPDAIYQQTTATMDGGEFQGKPAIFKATGSVMTDPGWKKLYSESQDDDDQPAEAANPVPVLVTGATETPERGEVLSKSTKAPSRYTEATLIKALEDHGVGRPSTYASIIKVLFARAYVEQKSGKPPLYPTPLGEAVVTTLAGRFDFADLDWTREIEDSLDQITQGQAQPRVTMQKVWDSLQQGLAGMPAGAVPATEPCPVEGCTGQESKNKPGNFFWSCSIKGGHGLLQDADGHPGQPFADRPKATPEAVGPQCKKCKVATGKFSTKTGKPYFRCQKCSGAWWPDKSDATALGEKWKAMAKK
ncbi:type I DNA topoisomerase [Acidithiobacillus ferrianus]|uniref:DNA topoisomerase 1 n=2 Tax=Acidithiobacillus ferrianus TaxID=2678518 RepID=A0A845UC56_9PROT|nr:type I DNA topoisomerase [Acidithiobacillus ferrianus]NDU43347.1 type I DNA topoisomerase [Acidithiobacillus ferrianus]